MKHYRATEAGKHRRIGGQGLPAPPERNRSAWSWRSLGVAFFLLLLNFNDLPAPLRDGLVVVSAFLAAFDPGACLVYVAGSQAVADGPSLPLTNAQLFIAVWLATLPFNGSGPWLRQSLQVCRYSVPFFAYFAIITAINGTFNEVMPYTFISLLIAGAYAVRVDPLARGTLVCLALGAFVLVFAYWADSFGLSVEGKEYIHEHRGGRRKGVGRSDVNFASVNIGVSYWVLLGVALISGQARRLRTRAVGVMLVLTVLAVPPLLAMGSRGGFAYLILGLPAFMLLAVQSSSNRRTAAAWLASIFVVGALMAATVPDVITRSAPVRVASATLQFSNQQADEFGGGAIGGRADIWGRYLAIIGENPLFGVSAGQLVDLGEYGLHYVGEGATKGTGHNFVLDLMTRTGVFGLVFFLYALLRPLLRLRRARVGSATLPLMMGLLVSLLAMSNLSIIGWKTFWLMYVLMVSVGDRYRSAAPKSGMAGGRGVACREADYETRFSF